MVGGRHRPDWFRTEAVWSEGKQEHIHFCVVDDVASLVWLAQDTNPLNVMTMDVRDFSRYRLPDGRAFHIH